MIFISLRFILCIFFLQYLLVAYSSQSSEKIRQSHPSPLSDQRSSKESANRPVRSGPSGDCSKSRREALNGGSTERGASASVEQYQDDTATVSYYNLPGNRTANGEMFDPNKMTTAHKSLPFNTVIQLSNPENGRSIRVRVNDRGPFIPGREFDISKGAAECLGTIVAGVVALQVRIISQPQGAVKKISPI